VHHVTRFDASELAVPPLYDGHCAGYGRVSHVGRAAGAVHTELGTCELEPQGRLDPHVHSFEEFFYVLEGNPVLMLDGRAWELAPDECGFIGVAATHAWRNPGPGPARWIDLMTPLPRDEGEPPDTFFVAGDADAEPCPVDVRDPRARSFARWRPQQMDLDLLKNPSAVTAPEVSASMSSALLAYSGITVKMLVDERHGAALGNLFMVDYYPGVVLHPHDHPLEEAFYMLEGEVVYSADGEEHTLRAGDVAYAGVGCIHAFENRTDARCRWLESRAPQPPSRHAYRFNRDWDHLAAQVGVAAAAAAR
jgi:quercetin dioxygenase-like cupin family protein